MADGVDLTTDLCGLSLRTPILAVAWPAGYIDELPDVLDPALLGAIVTKSITADPREGHPPWRVIESPHGMLNAIGLENVGLDAFVREKLPAAECVNTTIIGSIAGNGIADYVKVAAAFDQAKHLPAVELNVSCPNTSEGLQFGESQQALRDLITEVRPTLSRTKLIVKLSPNVGDIVRMAETAIEAGADALTLINTFSAMAIEVETRKARLSNTTGGLSGPAIHPIAVRMVHAVYRGVARDANVPIIGLGGVLSWRDAAEMVLAGASAVGVGTALFVEPRQPKHIVKGLAKWTQRQGCQRVSELIGRIDE